MTETVIGLYDRQKALKTSMYHGQVYEDGWGGIKLNLYCNVNQINMPQFN